MKNIIFIIGLLVGLSAAATAQTQSGKIFIGGNINWNNNDSENIDVNSSSTLGLRTNKQYTFKLEGTSGIFIAENLVLGLFLNIVNNKNESSNTVEKFSSTNKSNSLNVGPFIRKFFPLNEKFSFYTQGNVGYGHSTNRETYETVNQNISTRSKYNGLVAALKPGLIYFATNKLGVDLSVKGLQYTLSKEKDTDQSISRFDAGFNLTNLTIGLNLYLGR